MENTIGKDELEAPRAFGDKANDAAPANLNPDEGGEPATEEEQMDYDLLVIRARKMMFGDGREDILTMLGSSETPAQGIGKVGSMLVKSLRQSAKQGGRDITDEVAINAAAEIGKDLSDLAKSAGVYKYDSDKDELEELEDAMLWGVKYYGDGMIANGEITPEMQAQAAQVVKEQNTMEVERNPDMTKEQRAGLKQSIQQGIADSGAPAGPTAGPGADGIIGGAMPGGV